MAVHRNLVADCFDDVSLDDNHSFTSLRSTDWEVAAESKISDLIDNMAFLEEADEANLMVDSSPLEWKGMCSDPFQVQDCEMQSSFVNTGETVLSSYRPKSQPSKIEPPKSQPLPSVPSIRPHNVSPEPVPYNHEEYQRRWSYNDAPTEYDHEQYQRPSSCADLTSMGASRRRAATQNRKCPRNWSCTDLRAMGHSTTTQSKNCFATHSASPQHQASGLNSNSVRQLNIFGGADTSLRNRVLYEDSLQKLAASMERTEQSRKLLGVQRSIMGVPTQPRHFGFPERIPESPDETSSRTADFFSRRRDTLTDGLEESRRQLKSYVEQLVNHQVL